jgi:hypothetical protein
MAVGLPLKTTYANGDVYSASDVNDTNGTINTTAAPYAAGKNKIINGDFNVNQRSFSTTSTNNAYGFDRWKLSAGTGTFTYSAQTFTAGTAPVTGYEGTNYARLVTSGQTATSGYAGLQQQVESVRTFANQTVTLSFWAKASSGTPKVQPTLEQVFGTSGSAGVQIAGTSVTISTSWARYSATIAVPSISGKTIGASNFLSVQLYTSLGTDYPTYGNIGVQAATIDFWGVQLEAGSTATAFQTATGTIQGELAACQRYLPAFIGQGNSFFGFAQNTTTSKMYFKLPTNARVAPTGITVSTLSNFTSYNKGYSGGTPTAITFDTCGPDTGYFSVSTTAGSPTFVAGEIASLQFGNSSASILFTGCEL